MNRINAKFKELRKNKKKAFIAFITAGYPNLGTTYKLVLELSKSVDILELGVPFSDPLADGPVIQEASFQALIKNTHLADIIKLVKKCRKSVNTPICLMTYYNPVYCFGEGKFVKVAKAAGVDGVIIPDLPPEEGRPLIKLANKEGLDVIAFLAPTSTLKRIKFVSKIAKGFIYYVSLTGVTGARKGLSSDLGKNIKLIKRFSAKPVCVGFGLSTKAQVKEASKFADGVIVGSAIVKKIKENIGRPDLPKRVSSFVASLKS